jgi:hexosaminidase
LLPLALLCASAAVAAPAEIALMPQPTSTHLDDARLPLAGGFDIAWSGCRNAILDRAADRFRTDVARLTGMTSAGGQGLPLKIVCAADDPGFLTVGMKESYGLKIDGQGVTISAEGPSGVLRGLATIRQLIAGSPGAFSLPTLTIADTPRFVWRGVMVDTARHFISLATLKRQLDAMELVKLNVLHLHLSDNEGFRVESRLYPKLQETGSHGQFYTQQDIRDLVVYAADRGIRIVPEFDLPGHAYALLSSYPELASAPVSPVGGTIAAMSALIDPSSDKTYRFLDRFFGEMAGLFPDNYFHVGADEVNGKEWEANPAIQAFALKEKLTSNAALEGYFHSRVRSILKAHGKTAMGWEEIAEAPALPSDVLVETWRNSNASARVTAKGNPIVVSAGYYLDHMEAAAQYYAVDPLDPNAYGLTSGNLAAVRANPNPLLAKLLTGPMADAILPPVMTEMQPLSEPQRKLVLGGEAPIWGEFVTDEMLDGRLWPAAAAVAERYWSPAGTTDAPDMYRQLIVTQDELRRLGLKDQANRDRMAARLAPGQSGPVSMLAELVGPTRNGARGRQVFAALFSGKPVSSALSDVNELADVAPSDSLVAHRFALDVQDFIGGNRDKAAELRARLECWRNNHAAFSKVAAGKPKLEAAMPISADVAALAELGLAAMAAIEAGRPLAAEVAVKGKALLDRQDAAEKASASQEAVFMASEQPPADLLIAVTPGIRTLMEAASRTP